MSIELIKNRFALFFLQLTLVLKSKKEFTFLVVRLSQVLLKTLRKEEEDFVLRTKERNIKKEKNFNLSF